MLLSIHKQSMFSVPQSSGCLTWVSFPWTRHRCSSSGDLGYGLPAGWSHTLHLWHRRHSRAGAPHTDWVQMPHPYCAFQCHVEAPGWAIDDKRKVSLHVIHMQSDATLSILYYTHSIQCCALLPVADQASSEFPGSHRSQKIWAWTAHSLCGQARSVGCSCFYPIVVQPPEFLWAS